MPRFVLVLAAIVLAVLVPGLALGANSEPYVAPPEFEYPAFDQEAVMLIAEREKSATLHEFQVGFASSVEEGIVQRQEAIERWNAAVAENERRAAAAEAARQEAARQVRTQAPVAAPATAAGDPDLSNLRWSVSTWEGIAACESGQRWDLNTGNGYYGGLQFAASTWRSAGGTQFAPYAHLATRAQQIWTADQWWQAVERQSGYEAAWRQWPTCSRRAGLR